MIRFEVQGMSCGHCVSSVTQAIHAVDPGAQVQVDLASGHVTIEHGTALPERLAEAIRQAGYTVKE